jgi:hypothetical protein
MPDDPLPRPGRIDLPGVFSIDTDDPVGTLPAVADRLREEGIRFRDITGEVPWLVAAEPYFLAPRIKAELDRIAKAVFDYLDFLQARYRADDELVKMTLDGMTPPSLCGIDLQKGIEMFRLDILVENGSPKITEIEEIFGNAGKVTAMATAYDLPTPYIVPFMVERGVEHIIVCDDYPEYVHEVAILARHAGQRRGRPIQVGLVSSFDFNTRGPVWRFVSTAELARFGTTFCERLRQAGIDFVNPLFHGFGTKAALALLHDERMAVALERGMDALSLDILKGAVPHCFMLEGHESDAAQLLQRRRKLVLKVTDCPELPLLTWGSRGVYFGERSRREWEARLGLGLRGLVASSPHTVHPARLLVSDLVEADRVDVRFLHPNRKTVSLMPRSRFRLGPIYVRQGGKTHFAGGHATFVNTSRKVHLGKHAVCAPLRFDDDG